MTDESAPEPPKDPVPDQADPDDPNVFESSPEDGGVDVAVEEEDPNTYPEGELLSGAADPLYRPKGP